MTLSHNSSTGTIFAPLDYQNYSNEVELLNRDTGLGIANANDVNRLTQFTFKSSSSSTASFPVTMSITNFRIYTKVYN